MPKTHINRSCRVLALLLGSYTFLKRKSKSLRLSGVLMGLAGGATLVLSATTDSQTTNNPNNNIKLTEIQAFKGLLVRVYIYSKYIFENW